MSFTSGKIYNPYLMTWQSSKDFFDYMKKDKQMTEQNKNAENTKPQQTTEDEDVMQQMVDEGNETTDTDDAESDEDSKEDSKK